MPSPLHFAAVWMVNLQPVESGQYVYAVTHLAQLSLLAPSGNDFGGVKA